MAISDKDLTCRDCGVGFVFTVGEQEFFASKGFANESGRCPACRGARRSQQGDTVVAAGTAVATRSKPHITRNTDTTHHGCCLWHSFRVGPRFDTSEGFHHTSARWHILPIPKLRSPKCRQRIRSDAAARRHRGPHRPAVALPLSLQWP